MTDCRHCTRRWPSPVEVAVVGAAALAGLVLTGVVAAVSLVWRATDVDLPDTDELAGLLEVSAW